MENKINLIKFIDGSGYGYGYGDGSGSGDGYGDGSGSGDGYGSGYGYGYGSGSGDGSGYGDGYGDGSGDGSGYGYGYGDGSGSGDGSGDGSGSGYKLKKINDKTVFLVDNVPTVIDRIFKNNIAKGKMVNILNFSLEPCYIVKNNGFFAHGKTIKEAITALQEKIFAKMDTNKKIVEFCNTFNDKDKYQGRLFYEWHHILTGSCKMGRDAFVKNNNISLKKKYTVKEFINICENYYGGEIIKKLKYYYEE